MTAKRWIGSGAVVGPTAAFLLLTGLVAANGDELSDLRANQQLLQQRIDQLPPGQVQPTSPQAPGAGGPDVNGTPAAPGQPLLGGSFPRSFLIPGTDTSIRVSGSIDETVEHR